jgi:hypothetical protein
MRKSIIAAIVVLLAVDVVIIHDAFADSGSAVVTAPLANEHLPPTTVTIAPSGQLHNPLEQPADAIDDLVEAKRLGWPALVLVGGIMLAYAVRFAAARWDVAWVDWLNTGKRAFVISAVIAVGSSMFDVLVLGGTPVSIFLAGFASLIAMANATGAPKGTV